jgi:hypothetical protein
LPHTGNLPTTDNIPNDSCHPTEQKLAAIRYLTNCLLNYLIKDSEGEKKDVMKQTLYNNKYYTTILNKVIQKNMKKEQECKKEKSPKNSHT